MICKACGTENEKESMFCADCGATLEKEEVVEETVEEVVEEYYDAETEKPASNPGKLFGILSLICGILIYVGTLCAMIPFVNFIVAPCEFLFSIAAIVLGIIGKKKSKNAGCKNILATIGMILGLIPWILALIMLVIVLIVVAIMAILAVFGVGSGS